jgi:hypothetical protein
MSVVDGKIGGEKEKQKYVSKEKEGHEKLTLDGQVEESTRQVADQRLQDQGGGSRL